MLKQACLFCQIVGGIAIVGALNWGMIGFFGVNVVESIFGVGTMLTDVIYGLVGLSGLALLASYFVTFPLCKK